MKRFALLVAALAVTAGAQAQDSEFKHGGEFRLRYFNDINSTGQDQAGQRQDARSRFKYNLSARKGESVQAFLGVLHGTRFGDGGNFTGTTTADNLLLVNRAWGWWKATDTLSFKVGRFGLEIADGAIFSENDWEDVPTAHEGLALMWDWEFARLAALALKQAEITPVAGGGSDPEANQYVISADVKNMPEVVKLANIHFIQNNRDEAAPAAGQSWMQYGLTIGGDIGPIMYKGTASFQNGSIAKTAAADTKIAANMFDVMVGYGMPDLMGLKLSLGYHMDSGDDDAAAGDDKTYRPGFYDKHNYAGLMDVVEWGNLSYFNVNASILAQDDLEAGIGYYMFSRTASGAASAGTTLGTRYGTLAGALGEKDLGSELDIFANKAYDAQALKIGARYSMFMPGSYFKNATPARDKTLMQVMLQASMAF